MKVRLRAGVSVDQAIGTLELLAVNAYGEAMPVGPSHPADRRDEYVRWAVRTEQRVGSVLRRSDAAALFENPGHRDICVMVPGNHLGQLISAEVDAKVAYLRELISDFRVAAARMKNGSGTPTVVDTNVVIEHQRPDSVNWPKLVGISPVRLILPLRVIEEVDAFKFQGHERRRQAARDFLPWLEKLLANGTGPVPIRSETTIELQLEDVPRNRPMDADEEILDFCELVRSLAGEVRLVTADSCMRLRARARGLDVLPMDETYRRLASTPLPKQPHL